MSNKLIGLDQLQEFKTRSDAKYQDKLTAGSNISINNDEISSNPWVATYVAAKNSGEQTVNTGSIVNLGSVTLAPGKYFIVYTCTFAVVSGASAVTGYVQAGFSANTTDITGFGRGWGDNRKSSSLIETQTSVSGVTEILASDYPNGRTFYMLAKHNTRNRTCYPRCYYIKFG